MLDSNAALSPRALDLASFICGFTSPNLTLLVAEGATGGGGAIPGEVLIEDSLRGCIGLIKWSSSIPDGQFGLELLVGVCCILLFTPAPSLVGPWCPFGS